MRGSTASRPMHARDAGACQAAMNSCARLRPAARARAARARHRPARRRRIARSATQLADGFHVVARSRRRQQTCRRLPAREAPARAARVRLARQPQPVDENGAIPDLLANGAGPISRVAAPRSPQLEVELQRAGVERLAARRQTQADDLPADEARVAHRRARASRCARRAPR